MHTCPCCGYKTLPCRGDYDTCPVCWWEDDGGGPLQFSGPNARTLIEAQQVFLADERPFRRREGRVRAPKRIEQRDPGWSPYVLTEDGRAQIRADERERQREAEAERVSAAQELAENPEGPFKEYNASMRILKAQSSSMSYPEVLARTRELGREHNVGLPEAYLVMSAHRLKNRDYYSHHPLRAIWWLLRFSSPRTIRRRWRELRTGTIRFVR